MGLMNMFMWVAVTVRLYTHMLWLALNREGRFTLFPPRPRGKLFRKIVIMGDGFATGVGDWVTMGGEAGAARDVAELIRRDKTIRANWIVTTTGHHGATSDEWTPECTRKPVWWRWVLNKTLWKDFVRNEYFNDADIVVLAVGSMDAARHSRCRDDPTKTAQNIEAIAKALHVLGKIVCVCTLPPSVPDQEQRNASVNATVKALVRRAYLEQSRGSDADAATKKEDQAALSWIVAGPNLGSSMFADASLFCFDGHHFSSKGHRKFGKELFRCLVPHMKAIEFRELLDVLTSKQDRRKLFDHESTLQATAPERPTRVKLLRGLVVLVSLALGMLGVYMIVT